MTILFFVQGRRGLHFIDISHLYGFFVARNVRKIPRSREGLKKLVYSLNKNPKIRIEYRSWSTRTFKPPPRKQFKEKLEVQIGRKIRWIETVE